MTRLLVPDNLMAGITKKTRAKTLLNRIYHKKGNWPNSLDAQEEFSQYTQRTGDNLGRFYAYKGIYGTKTKNHKESLRMLADVEHDLFDMTVYGQSMKYTM